MPGADPQGISLERYAAVVAAVAEPFARGRVLALEELDPAEFLAAEIAWKKRLARRDGADFARYREALAAAEDWLIRRVTPLYQEPEAWAAFLAAMRASPGEVLSATGLGNNDFARLTRHWARLVKEDPGLGRDIEVCLSAGRGALPAVAAEPRQLRRSRVFTARPQPRSAAPAARPARERVIVVAEIAPERVVPHPAPPSAPAPIPISAPEEHETAALPAIGYLHRKPSLPFSPAAPEEHGTAALPAVVVSPPALPFAPRAAEEHGTAALPAVAAPRPSLPFAPAASAPPVSSPPAGPRSATPFVARAVEEHGTAALPAIKAPPPALPFAPRAAEEHGTQALPAIRLPVDAAPPPSARAPESRAPESQAPVSRAPVSRAPVSSPPELPLRLEQYASLCVELGARPDRAAEITARYGLSPEGRAALDAAYAARFARDPALQRAFHHAAAAYSAWLGAARAAPPISAPAFTLEQYASLVVDLARWPDRRAETMARYRLSEPQRAALDAAFAARFAQDPGARQAFERACLTYQAMLARAGR